MAIAFTQDERSCFYNAIINLDSEVQYIICDIEKDTLSYTSKINSEENISGKPTDEELTRALIVLNLISFYGYSSERIFLEDRFEIGGHNFARARAFEGDIMIKTEDLSEYESMIEVKRIQNFKGSMDPQIKAQLFNAYENINKYRSVKNLYFVSCDVPIKKDSFLLSCVGIKTELAETYDKWVKQGRPTHLIDFLASDKNNLSQTAMMKLDDGVNVSGNFHDLKDDFGIDTIKRAWRTIWDAIWGGTLESNKKFENFNKVLLAKIYDERKTPIGVQYAFQYKAKVGKKQTNEELAQDIDNLYKKAYIEYFSKDKTVDIRTVKGIDFSEFSYDLVSICVSQLFQYSFDKNLYKNVDILGEFYEMVIRESFKQTKGLFLTHPNIVLFILSALDVKELAFNKLQAPDEDTRYRLPFVIDPSCGTGTFLVYYMNFIQKYIDEEKSEIAAGDTDISNFISRETQNENKYKWVKDYVFGLDNDAVLATACQINQILHGDGSTNIYFADGLDDFEKYSSLDIVGAHNILSSNIINSKDYYDKKVINKFDLIISNPPFNVSMNKENLKPNFNVTGKSEAYFLERWYQLLKPKGRIGVVLPESFFSVEEDIVGREFLYKHFNIKCIVSLPNFAFSPHTTTSTSLLFAEKKSEREEQVFYNQHIKYENVFKSKLNSILSILPQKKANVNFDNKDALNGIGTILNRIESESEKEYGTGFVIFPFFTQDILMADNYSSVKKKIKDVIISIKEQWILFMIHSDSDIKFHNYSVESIGYKAGKKGSKDKPNDLMTIKNNEGKQIYDLKYAHSWTTIEFDDIETVLGQIKGDSIWE